jgi:hypothetical protein
MGNLMENMKKAQELVQVGAPFIPLSTCAGFQVKPVCAAPHMSRRLVRLPRQSAAGRVQHASAHSAYMDRQDATSHGLLTYFSSWQVEAAKVQEELAANRFEVRRNTTIQHRAMLTAVI